MSFKAKIPSFCEINYQQNPRPCFCRESVQAGPMLSSPTDAFWAGWGCNHLLMQVKVEEWSPIHDAVIFRSRQGGEGTFITLTQLPCALSLVP